MKKHLLRFAIIIIVLLFSLVAAEITVRKVKPQITFSQAVADSIDCYDKDPSAHFTLAKNYTCRMTNQAKEFEVSARLNSLGYRGEEFTKTKKPGEERVLIIGDSITFGWGVGDNETYPYILGNILKEKGVTNTLVINGGYAGGLSPDSYYAYLKDRGMKLAPDILILGLFVGNDITDLEGNIWREQDALGLPQKVSFCCYEVDGRILRNKITSAKYTVPLLRESHLFLLFIDTLQKRFGVFPEKSLLTHRGETMMFCPLNPDCIHLFSPQEEKTLKIIKEMKNMADENESLFLVVLLPVDVQLYPEAKAKYARYNFSWYPKTGEETFLQKRLGNFLSQNDIKYLDLYQYFDQNRNRGYPFFPIDGHFNSIGTQLTAEAIAQYLMDKKWVR